MVISWHARYHVHRVSAEGAQQYVQMVRGAEYYCAACSLNLKETPGIRFTRDGSRVKVSVKKRHILD